MAKKLYAHMTRCINGTTIIRIPPGAEYPLPASVRRELTMLRKIADLAYGLSLGQDWNNGTMAKTHGYRSKLVLAVQEYRSATKAKGRS